MNQKNIYLISTIVIAVVGFILYAQVIKPQLDDRMVTTVVPMTITSTELALEFTYPSGEAAYTLIEPTIPTTTPDGLQKVYLLMNNQSYLDYQAKGEDGIAPPTVSVFILQNPELSESEMEADYTTRLQTWADRHTRYSSFRLKNSEPEIVELDGVTALRYRADGVYEQEVYVASHDGHTYVFTGQFEAETDDIYKMYTDLISSIIFN